MTNLNIIYVVKERSKFDLMESGLRRVDGYADIKMITRVLADEGLRSRLRGMNSSSDLYDALLNGSALVAPEQLNVAQGS